MKYGDLAVLLAELRSTNCATKCFNLDFLHCSSNFFEKNN